MAEFTGERIIPGAVDADLFNEHMARYAFAARLSRGKRVLDAGCGSGYGSAELAGTARAVVGLDISADAVSYARENFRLPNLQFARGSVAALPFPDACLDLVVSFEVIEHLSDWAAFLGEVRRVLVPTGQFIVSTPNRLYYAETRERTGPNPFHVHEFDFAGFREALAEVFPHVLLFLENHVDGVAFQPLEHPGTAEVRVEPSPPAPAESHFFVAVCAHRPQTGNPTFVYLPRAGNVLRERERHIALLKEEIESKNRWLEDAEHRHQETLGLLRAGQAELERSNAWALSVGGELEATRARIAELQEELAREQAAACETVAGLERENNAKTEWALRLQAELAEAVRMLHAAEATVEERTRWAQRLDAEVAELQKRLAMYQASRWVRMGRRMGLGPRLAP